MTNTTRDQSYPEHVKRATRYELLAGAHNVSRRGTKREARWPTVVKYDGHADGVALAKHDGRVTKRHLHMLERNGCLRFDTSPPGAGRTSSAISRPNPPTTPPGRVAQGEQEAPPPDVNPSDAQGAASETDDERRNAAIRVRRGQPQFRAKLLAAYAGRCAVTGTALEPLLEAAHIVPHASGTDYRMGNGLLLRADIHTLFDLYHLSVDGTGKVFLSRDAMRTDYAAYHGKTIRLPPLHALRPSTINLENRHRLFLAKESERAR